MATFPSYGTLMADGFSKKRASAVKRSSFEDGFSKQAKRFSRVLVERTVTYSFTAANYASFITWFNTSIDRGAGWFDWTDPETSTTKTARIKNGDLLEETPVNPNLANWDVKFVLEVWDA